MRYPVIPPAGEVVGSHDAGEILIREFVYPAGFHLDRHCHSNAYLMFVLAGSYSEEISRRAEICHAGTVRFLPAGEPHANEYRQGARCLHLELNERRLNEIDGCSLSDLYPGKVDTPAIPAIITRLYREFSQPDDLSSLAIRSLTMELLVECQRSYRGERRNPSWVRLVEGLLRDRFTERVTLEEIARQADIHVVHMCREFRNKYGCTIGEFLRRLRVERACKLLSSTDVPLVQIALEVGFTDQSHLSSLFKRQIGLTPGQYRQLFRFK